MQITNILRNTTLLITGLFISNVAFAGWQITSVTNDYWGVPFVVSASYPGASASYGSLGLAAPGDVGDVFYIGIQPDATVSLAWFSEISFSISTSNPYITFTGASAVDDSVAIPEQAIDSFYLPNFQLLSGFVPGQTLSATTGAPKPCPCGLGGLQDRVFARIYFDVSPDALSGPVPITLNWATVSSSESNISLVSGQFQIAPVPEADTSAMLLTGLGVVGLMARRKKNSAV